MSNARIVTVLPGHAPNDGMISDSLRSDYSVGASSVCVANKRAFFSVRMRLLVHARVGGWAHFVSPLTDR